VRKTVASVLAAGALGFSVLGSSLLTPGTAFAAPSDPAASAPHVVVPRVWTRIGYFSSPLLCSAALQAYIQNGYPVDPPQPPCYRNPSGYYFDYWDRS
jgi:hypothetical protein